MSEYESLRKDLDGIAGSLGRYADAVGVFTEVATDEVKRLWADNAELRAELHALANRVETLTRARLTEPAETAARMVDGRQS
jgi:non-ribosomal peptide synthetase component F